MPRFPSPEWLQAYCAAINASAEFREAAKDWEGDVTFVVEADPEKGLLADNWDWFDLQRGECRQARPVSPDEGERAAFVIRAPYNQWRDVIQGRLEPTRGMLQGKLKLKGDLHAITRNVDAVNALVSLAREIDTEFLD